MKKLVLTLVALVLCLSMCISPLTALAADESLSGKLVMADFSWLVEEDRELIAEFNKLYPNIEVEVVSIPDDLERNDYLANQAVIGQMPDLVRSPWHEIPVDLSQGWLYPLNEFLEADDEFFQYVSPAQYETFYYGDSIYCLPYTVGFTCIVLNLDLLDEMNEDVPAYEEWTIDEFTRLARKATTATTSGIDHLWNFDYFLPAQMDAKLVDGCLNEETGLVDLTSGAWIDSVNLVKELKSVPGLVANELWNDTLRNNGEIDDYEKKFGKDADAVADGKVLMAWNGSTWSFGTHKNFSFNWDYYPLPFTEEVGYRSQAHNDVMMMTSATQNPEAAFALLKFLTYGKDGCMVRLNRAAANEELFIPTTRHPEVVDAFKALSYVPAGVMYMYDNVDKSIHGDHYRYVPDFNTATGSMQGEERQAIYDGQVEAAAVAAEMESKINAWLSDSAATFQAQFEKAQAEFNATHQK